MRTFSNLLAASAALALLATITACTSTGHDPEVPSERPTSQESALSVEGLNPNELQYATGDFISPDGRITGEVKIAVTEVNGLRLADLEFVNLSAPYETLGIGGSLAPRGDDPCFDAGLRASAGEWPVTTTSIPMAMEISSGSRILHEIVLYESFYNYENEHSCTHLVVARAPLTWE